MENIEHQLNILKQLLENEEHYNRIKDNLIQTRQAIANSMRQSDSNFIAFRPQYDVIDQLITIISPTDSSAFEFSKN